MVLVENRDCDFHEASRGFDAMFLGGFLDGEFAYERSRNDEYASGPQIPSGSNSKVYGANDDREERSQIR